MMISGFFFLMKKDYLGIYSAVYGPYYFSG